jgi:hypothetical protein
MSGTETHLAMDESGQLQALIRDFNREFNIWNRIKKDLTQIEKEVKAKEFDPFLVYRKLEKHANSLKSKIFLDEPERLDSLLQLLNEQCRNYLRQYQNNFIQKAKDCDLSVSGQFPQFFIEGFLELKIDERSYSAQINGLKVESPFIPSIIQQLQETYKELWKRDFDAPKFLQHLCQAYRLVIYGHNRSMGDQAPIREIYPHIVMLMQSKRFIDQGTKDSFQSYTIEQFTCDLSKLIESNKMVTDDGLRLDLLPASDSREALFVYVPARTKKQYYGRVRFSRRSINE